jgi:Ca-activated chloride channel family protein
MSFQEPQWLVLLLLVPAGVAGIVLAMRRRGRLSSRYADPRLVRHGLPRRTRAVRAVAATLAMLALGAAVLAAAQPVRTVQDRRSQGAVMVAIDTSKSMLEDDLQPSRRAAALDAARRFVEDAPKDVRIGFIEFGDTASVVISPTTDRAALQEALDTRFSRVRVGTAIGDAITLSLNALQADGVLTPPAATPQESAGRVLLLTDGAQSAGTVTPEDGAQRAAAVRVPVYTILLGDDPGRADQAPPADVLAQVSSTTGGVSAQTTTTADLERVFADIGKMVAPRPRVEELAWIPAGVALVLLLTAGLVAATASPLRRGRASAAGPRPA